MAIDFVNNGPKEFDSYEELFNEYCVKIFKELELNGEFITEVSIVDNKKIREINANYRQIDRETDVISFAFLDEPSEKKLKGGPIDLGLILISYEKAIQQANEYGHSLKREMVFLFVHGMLHLLGYDHMKEEDEKIMFSIQDKILGGLK